MMIDVLDYMLPESKFCRGWHMASAQSGVNSIYGFWQPNWIWQIKVGATAGFPWDGNFYDEQYVYQNITEGPNGWTDPTSYKAFASKSWANGHGGIVWSPRYISDAPATKPNFVVTADSTYKTYQSGSVVGNPQNLGGPIVTTVTAPQLMKVGALGMVECLVQTYQWGAGLTNMEVNYYALFCGWVMWELYSLQGGLYTLTKYSMFDQKTAGGTPTLKFPNVLP